MPFHIKAIHDENIWTAFLNDQKPHTFLHSWEWGEFQKSVGEKIWRLGCYDKEKLIGIGFFIRVQARRGSFLFCPHGPICTQDQEKKDLGFRIFKELFDYARCLAKEENCRFFRVSPLLDVKKENQQFFQDYGFRFAPIHMHSELGWILDVSVNEEDLLRGMRKTTRHEIQKAKREGVEIRASTDKNDLKFFYDLYEETVERKVFVPFSHDYLLKEFEAFSANGNALLFLGSFHGQVVSGAMIIFSNTSAFYHHGASSRKFSKIPAAHLLHWEIIREVKRRGLRYYNFWGVSPDDKPYHPWKGASLFKKGFGGFLEPYLHAQDFPLRSWYWLTYGIETFRRIKRSL